MRRLRVHSGYLLAFVLATNGLWLPLHFAVAHAPDDAESKAASHACKHHHHGHDTHAHTDQLPTRKTPSAPGSHECDLCDLLLTFTAAEVETRVDAPPHEPLAERLNIAPNHTVVITPMVSLGARAPPLG